jgi:hypothetical protein
MSPSSQTKFDVERCHGTQNAENASSASLERPTFVALVSSVPVNQCLSSFFPLIIRLYQFEQPKVKVLCLTRPPGSSAKARISTTLCVFGLHLKSRAGSYQLTLLPFTTDGHIHLFPIHRGLQILRRGNQREGSSRKGLFAWLWYYHRLRGGHEDSWYRYVFSECLEMDAKGLMGKF